MFSKLYKALRALFWHYWYHFFPENDPLNIEVEEREEPVSLPVIEMPPVCVEEVFVAIKKLSEPKDEGPFGFSFRRPEVHCLFVSAPTSSQLRFEQQQQLMDMQRSLALRDIERRRKSGVSCVLPSMAAGLFCSAFRGLL